MKVLVLIAGLLFLVVYVTLETNDCGMCSFDGNKIDKFMNHYSEECLQIEKGLPNIIYQEPGQS